MGEVVQLQGDQRQNVRDWLVEQEIVGKAEADDRIVIHGCAALAGATRRRGAAVPTALTRDSCPRSPGRSRDPSPSHVSTPLLRLPHAAFDAVVCGALAPRGSCAPLVRRRRRAVRGRAAELQAASPAAEAIDSGRRQRPRVARRLPCAAHDWARLATRGPRWCNYADWQLRGVLRSRVLSHAGSSVALPTAAGRQLGVLPATSTLRSWRERSHGYAHAQCPPRGRRSLRCAATLTLRLTRVHAAASIDVTPGRRARSLLCWQRDSPPTASHASGQSNRARLGHVTRGARGFRCRECRVRYVAHVRSSRMQLYVELINHSHCCCCVDMKEHLSGLSPTARFILTSRLWKCA